MKSFTALFVMTILAMFSSTLVQGFAPVPTSGGVGVVVVSKQSMTSSTKLNLFGAPKDDGSPGDYLCPDCGYVFTKGPKAWAALPDSYSCPPCGAPKRRFKKVPKGSASGKVEVKKSWF